MRALVTGGSGYVGSAMVRHLLDHAHQVRVFDIRDAPDRPDEVEFVRGDIRDGDAIARAVSGCDTVFHNVAQVPLTRDERLVHSVNVDGTAALLRAAAAAGVDKVVHTSSSAVFGVPDRLPVAPHTVPNPSDPYGRTKLVAEWACLDAARRGLDVTIVRPRTVLGRDRLGIFGILFDWIADGADPIVLGDGSNRYQFVHVDDLAGACRLAGESPGPTIVNVGAADVPTMASALDGVCRFAGTGARVRRLPAVPAATAMRVSGALGLTPLAPYHALMYGRSMWFDIDHARQRIGWKPEWRTGAMLTQSYDWFREHRDEVDAGASPHRRAARQGALALVKRASRLLPAADCAPDG